jgi:hypothetical protein
MLSPPHAVFLATPRPMAHVLRLILSFHTKVGPERRLVDLGPRPVTWLWLGVIALLAKVVGFFHRSDVDQHRRTRCRTVGAVVMLKT